VVPCIKVNVVEVIVKGSIASVKNAPTLVLSDTLVAPSALIVLVTMGGVTSGAEPVVNSRHRDLPEPYLTGLSPAVIVAV